MNSPGLLLARRGKTIESPKREHRIYSDERLSKTASAKKWSNGCAGRWKWRIGKCPRQERAQVWRPDFYLHEDAGASRFGHRGLERQIPSLALLA